MSFLHHHLCKKGHAILANLSGLISKKNQGCNKQASKQRQDIRAKGRDGKGGKQGYEGVEGGEDGDKEHLLGRSSISL